MTEPINSKTMETKQTAIELLASLMISSSTLPFKTIDEYITQAKQIEKEQIIHTYWEAYKEGRYSGDRTAEEYYDETYTQQEL
jgi:HEPN domain-containing protein